MRKTILSVVLLFAFAATKAQTLEEGKRFTSYERYQSAINTFNDVLKQQPGHAEAVYELTAVYLLQGKTTEASQLLSGIQDVNSQPFYQAAYGYLLLNNGKKDSAAIYFNEALDRTKEKDPAVLAAVARAHVESKTGDANYAISLLDKAIRRDKNNAALYVLKGDAWQKLQNGSEAYEAYKEAYDRNSSYAPAYHKMGEIFVTQKNAEVYLENFNKAIQADPNYAPSYYKLYSHYFYLDPAKALEYYNQYAAKSDPSLQQQYDLADLFYLNKNYGEALKKANDIISKAGEETKPRIYKLMAYSYAGNADSTQATTWMQRYFAKEEDSNFVAKDFELMADLFLTGNQPDSAMAYYTKATELEKDDELLRGYYKKLATLALNAKDYSSQALWLGKYYQGNEQATNLDLFNWGLAHFRSEDFTMADSVFGMYVAKYPEQSFGYYWQARSNAMLDKDMETGLAVPYYQKLVEVLQNDTANSNYKNWMSQAYGYLAAYEANNQKDYVEAIDYFEKVLEVDPENADAKKYIDVLEKRKTEDESGK